MKERIKKLLSLLKTPPTGLILGVWIAAILFIAGALTMVFTGYAGIFSYPVYAFAALTLGYTVYTVVLFAPKIKASVQARLRKRKFTRDLTENYSFRTLVFATCSVVINLGFVAFNTVFAFLTGNVWYGSLAGYYFLLSVLRGGVFLSTRTAKRRARGDEKKFRFLQLKNYRRCGAALFALDVAMAVAVTLMVLSQKPTQYSEIMAIVFAAYTVYKIAFAVRNIFKAKRTRDTQIQSFRNIGLADAAISLLSLQTTLISTFSADGQDMTFLNALTGAFVCLFSIGIAVVMVVNANKRLKEEKEDYESEV